MQSDRPPQVLEAFLARAALRGERVVAMTRLLLCALFLGQWLFLSRPLGRTVQLVTFASAITAFVVGILYSAWALRYLVPSDKLKRSLLWSVCLDACIVGLALLPAAAWPYPGYGGFLKEGNLVVLVIAAISPGVRLSRSVAVVGSAMIVAMASALLTVDLLFNGPVLAYGALDIINFAIFLLGSSVLGYAVASRTRGLVFEGAEAAVSAERARQRLGIYVSEEVAQVAMGRTTLQLGGKRQEAAILFSDLRGFTPYTEKLAPEAVVAELNAYLDAMVQVIRSQGGVVDKFMGDAIMVVFGLPEVRGDDARRAIRTAKLMEEALVSHNQRRKEKGQAPFRHGIGIHCGPVVAGNIGNRERLQFTVIGDAVNLASRLQTATKELGTPVVISAEAVQTARAGGDGDLPPLRSLGSIQVPGRSGELEVFTLAEENEETGSRQLV